MATIRYTPNAPSVAQVATVAITGYDAATTYKITCNSKVVSVVGSTDAATTANNLKIALAASTIPEFAECTYAVNSTTITVTSGSAGRPFTMTSSVTGGGGTIGAVTTTVASSGPGDMSLAANYSGGALPSNGDTLIFEDCSVDILYNVDALAGVALAARYFRASFTGKLGLPEYNTNGYKEYRATDVTGGSTLDVVEDGLGAGSPRIRLNLGSTATTLIVRKTATSALTGQSAVQWKGTNAANVVIVMSGSVDIATYGGETAVVATLTVGVIPEDPLTAAADPFAATVSANRLGAAVRCGTGVTLTTVNQFGGELRTDSNITTLNHANGTMTILSGTVTTLNVDGGTVYDRSTGTVTTLNVGAGVYDLSQDTRAKTITDTNVYRGATINDPRSRATFTNSIVPVRCSLDEVTVFRSVGASFAT